MRAPRTVGALLLLAWLAPGIAAAGPGASAAPVPDGTLRPYDPFAPRASVLATCVLGPRRANGVGLPSQPEHGCELGRLPLLGMESPDPTVDDVMGRVLVSHAWMGTRFREVLMGMPRESLLLFRPLAAIVIGAEIRPSFYNRWTAAIYLDADNIWISPGERATVSSVPDYRSDYGRDLSFAVLWHDVWNGRPVSRDAGGRTLEVVRLLTARLLFHELAHANDLVAPQRLPGLSPFQRPRDLQAPPVVLPSDLLADAVPLENELLYRLASVRWGGERAGEAERSAATGVGAAFDPDGASHLYSYTSRYEDTAMLFEELMMHVSFGTEREIVFAPKPEAPNPTLGDYVVGWGRRNRLGDPHVRERARLVAAHLLPEVPLGAHLDAFPPATPLIEGWSMLDNLLAARGSIRGLESLRAQALREGWGEVEVLPPCGTATLEVAGRPGQPLPQGRRR